MNEISEEQFNAWLKSCPRAPVKIKFAESHLINPLIGDDIYETSLNIRYIVELFKDTTGSTRSDEDFNLSVDGTFGLSEIFKCMIGALKFEDECREDVLQNHTRSQSRHLEHNKQEGNHHE